MPPPPPPSKSYLLVLSDTSSEDDEDEREEERAYQEAVDLRRQEQQEQLRNEEEEPSSRSAVERERSNSQGSGLSLTDDDDDDEEGVDDTDEEPPEASRQGAGASAARNNNKSKKRRKRKKKKKKKKHHANHHTEHAQNNSAAAAASKAKQRKHMIEKKVSFGSVHTHEFGRCLGAHVVPGDGGWPLGLELEAIDTTNADGDGKRSSSNSSSGGGSQITSGTQTPIDEFESEKQERLRQRWNEWVERLQKEQEKTTTTRAKGRAGEDTNAERITIPDVQNPPEVLETRQLDYKRRAKNPLFGVVHEKERMRILLAYSNNPENKNTETAGDSSMPAPPPPSKKSSSPGGSPDRKPYRTRSRSRSFTETHHEQYNDTFTQVEVHHVRNELETLRNHRTKEGGAGCTCRKLHVFLLPQGKKKASKKAYSRRMSQPAVKQELRKRNLLPPADQKKTREELELLLHQAVEQEACCSTDDCFCVRNGLVCQADACSCWLPSHQGKPQQNGSRNNNNSVASITVEEIKARCGNKYGTYVVNEEEISELRNRYICQPAMTTTTTTSNTDG